MVWFLVGLVGLVGLVVWWFGGWVIRWFGTRQGGRLRQTTVPGTWDDGDMVPSC